MKNSCSIALNSHILSPNSPKTSRAQLEELERIAELQFQLLDPMFSSFNPHFHFKVHRWISVWFGTSMT